MRRDQFFFSLVVLSLANGLVGFVLNKINTADWSDFALNLFNTSAVVWIACFLASALLYDSALEDVITIPDAVIGLGVLAMNIIPLAKLSWLALTVLSLYMVSTSPPRSGRRRGAFIALAITGPTLWGPALMDLCGPAILKADAILVSTLIRTDRVGTIYSGVTGPDGLPTHFAIYPPCSSLHGMSIAILAFVTISNTLGSAWSARHILCALLAAVSVLAVNVSRLSLIGLLPMHFSAIHGWPGNEIAAWLSLALVVAISFVGVGREAFARA